jgi:hypothetical protein
MYLSYHHLDQWGCQKEGKRQQQCLLMSHLELDPPAVQPADQPKESLSVWKRAVMRSHRAAEMRL